MRQSSFSAILRDMEAEIKNNEKFSLTQSAAERIKFLKAKENNPKLRFRIGVKGGGCSGFQYDFSLDDKPVTDSDVIIVNAGAEAVIDEVSMGLLAGAALDYTEDLSHAGFSIVNPNATAKCGCGNSFSVNL